MSTAKKIQFLVSPTEDLFSKTLRLKVNEYFESKKLSKKADWVMTLKSVLYLTSYVATYALLMSNQLSFGLSLVCWMSIGALTAGIGFNIGHDAIHEAYSDKPWVNRMMGYSFLLLGANVYIWRLLHNIIHHSYTNISEADGDLHSVSLLRFHPDIPKRALHRYQHWYAMFLYCFTSLVWVFKKDYQHIFRKQHLIYKYQEPSKAELARLFGFKAAYYFAFIIAPFIFLSAPWWQIVIGFLAMHAVAGFALAVVFQLGHLVEGPEFPDLIDETQLDASWFSHQLRTSANFSTNSRVSDWLFGGLNYQIEHHLFPKICHIHYKGLSPIVQKVAAQYGLPYYQHPTFLSAVRSHLRYLKRVGQA